MGAAQPKMKSASEFAAKKPEPTQTRPSAPPIFPPAVSRGSVVLWAYGKKNPRQTLRIAAVIFFGLLATKCEIQSWWTWHEITTAQPKEIWAEKFAERHSGYNSIRINSDTKEELRNADYLWRKWENEYVDYDIYNGVRFFTEGLGKDWIADIKRAQAPQQAAYDAEVQQHDIGVTYQWAAGLLYLVAVVCMPPKWLLIGGAATVAALVGWVLWILLFGTAHSILVVATCLVLGAAGALYEAIRRAWQKIRPPTILAHSRFSQAVPSSVSSREV